MSRPLKVFPSTSSGQRLSQSAPQGCAHADTTAIRALYDRLVADGVDAWLDKEKLIPCYIRLFSLRYNDRE
ncbi:MAG: hypothetical protein HN916_09195 [Anaerolineae bacterium]|nr:hypothetical protein [Anaerolineae bacterium]